MINKVYVLRKQLKMTQEYLAKQVGVTRQTIISIEQGKYTASFTSCFKKIAKVFKKNVEDVFILEDND
ncbi:MAG: helix-turn-helix transcriptional regulator [Clostridium sp.]|nr:MAG: helix-turn-helix transcriptional regulator [Clostridium sp.]